MVYDLRTTEEKKQKKKILIIRLSIFFCVCALCIGGAVWASRMQRIQIDTIEVSGATVLSTQAITDEISSVLQGKYLWVFPRTNVFFYPRKNIENVLLHTFPRIKVVTFTLLDNHILQVKLKEREPFGLWCDTVSSESVVSQCYFLDADGFVFDRAPQFSGDAYFKYYGLLPYEASIGSYYLSSTTQFHELSQFVDTSKKLGITPLYIHAKDTDSFELVVFGGGKVLFDTRESLLKVSERLSALLKTPNLVPKEGGELLVEYIDLRFGNKMFFKPRLP